MMCLSNVTWKPGLLKRRSGHCRTRCLIRNHTEVGGRLLGAGSSIGAAGLRGRTEFSACSAHALSFESPAPSRAGAGQSEVPLDPGGRASRAVLPAAQRHRSSTRG